MKKILASLAVTCLAAHVGSQVPPPPPQPDCVTNAAFITVGMNTYRLWTPPSHAAAVTNITLTWDPYTNFFIVVSASTNLVDWYWKTNVPIWQTNVVIPISAPAEFFRIGCNYSG